MKTALPFWFAVLSAIPAASGVTLINDNFNDVTSADSINNRTPTTSNTGGNWSSSSSKFLGNGSGGLSVTYPTSTAGSATIDLGANYLSTNKGIYELTLDITHPSATSNDSWIGLGFANGNNSGANYVGNNGNPWMLYRLSGNANVYAGTGVNYSLASNVAPATS